MSPARSKLDSGFSGEFVTEELITTSIVVMVRKGSPRARARSLAQLADAKWVYTGANSESGYAKLLYERIGRLPGDPAFHCAPAPRC